MLYTSKSKYENNTEFGGLLPNIKLDIEITYMTPTVYLAHNNNSINSPPTYYIYLNTTKHCYLENRQMVCTVDGTQMVYLIYIYLFLSMCEKQYLPFKPTVSQIILFRKKLKYIELKNKSTINKRKYSIMLQVEHRQSTLAKVVNSNRGTGKH